MSEDSEMLIEHPRDFFNLKKTQLEKELGKIKLTEKEIKNLRGEHALQLLKDDVLGMIPVFKLATKILFWNKEVNDDIKAAKKEILLVNCCKKINQLENSIDSLKNFISTPTGNMLFNKIMQIIDDGDIIKSCVLDHFQWVR